MILTPLVIFTMEKTLVTMVICERKSVSRLESFQETGLPNIENAVLVHVITKWSYTV